MSYPCSSGTAFDTWRPIPESSLPWRLLLLLCPICANRKTEEQHRRWGREGDPGLAGERPWWEGELSLLWPLHGFQSLFFHHYGTVIFCGKSTGVCLRVNPPIWTTYPGPLEESAETSTEEGRCSWLLCTGSPHCCGRLWRKTPCICREAWRSPGGLSFV